MEVGRFKDSYEQPAKFDFNYMKSDVAVKTDLLGPD